MSYPYNLLKGVNLLEIRHETKNDIIHIHKLNAEVFGQETEANIVDSLRKRNVITLSLVATLNEEIVGHIFIILSY